MFVLSSPPTLTGAEEKKTGPSRFIPDFFQRDAGPNLRANPATSFDDFEKTKLLIRSDDLLKSFHEKTEPLFQQKHLLQQLCEWLKQTRENLLPRLISGKLPVENLDI